MKHIFRKSINKSSNFQEILEIKKFIKILITSQTKFMVIFTNFSNFI